MGEVIVHNEKGVPILVDRAVSAARPPRCKAGLIHNTVVMGKAGGARVQMDLRFELSGAADAAQIWELLQCAAATARTHEVHEDGLERVLGIQICRVTG
eukprot:41782-Prymnesium_polylepis.1